MKSREGQGREGRVLQTLGPESPVFLSLVRPSLTLGVERHVAALECVICLALTFGLGLSLATAVVVLVVVAAVHPVMLWLTQREPRVTELYIRNRGYADFYQPHGSAHADLAGPGQRSSAPAPRPTLPSLR